LEIDRIVNFGADLEIYLQNLLEKLRLMLLKIIGIEINNGQEVKLIENLGKTDITSLINAFTKATSEMKVTPIQQLPLELVAVEWCHLEVSSGDKEEKIVQKAEKKEETVPLKKETTRVETSVQDQGSGIKPILEKWGDLLLGVRPLNHSVEALLRASRPLKMDNGFLTLEVFYKFHKERLDSEKCRSIVEEVASQLLGNPVKLKCVLGEKNHSTEEKNNDIIEIASEIFNGKLVD
jgi:hypothetical protein